MITLTGASVLGAPGPTTVTVAEGSITGIGAPPAGDEIDVSGLTIHAGLIDLHINGAYGDDFTSDPEAMWRVGARLPEHGVTGFLPTIVTSLPETVAVARVALAARPAAYRGAEPLGLHLEGPMISPQRAGVHDRSRMHFPSPTVIEGWSSDEGIALVTLAPELDGAENVVDRLLTAGVVVSAGHSAADYQQAVAGFRWGITMVTHLFNAMEPLDHRAPGLIGAAIDSPGVVAGLIVDGIHAHPSVVRAAWKLLGPSRLALVTDATAAAGLGDGQYQLGTMSVDVSGGRATDSSGRLAGSTICLDQAVRNLVEFTRCSLAEAVTAASAVPAHVLGLRDRGRVAVGRRADLTLFDSSMHVAATMIGGDIVWRSTRGAI